MAKVSRRTWGVSLLIALGVIFLVGPIYYLAPNFLYVIEFNLFDQHFRLRGPRPANPQVAIVAIDEASVRAVGRWPWSRAVLADLVRKLDQAGAAAIAFDVLISEPEPSTERAALEKLTKRLGERNLDAPVRAELQKMASEADPDAALAAAIRDADRVVLASNFVFGSVPAAAPERKGSPMKSAIGVRSATDPPPASKAVPFTNYPERGDFPPLHATEETFPLPSLLAAASAVGHVNMIQESDGSTRYEALIVESRGYYYPGLAIEAIRVAAGLDPSARQVTFGDAIKLGDIVIPTDARSRVLIDYAGPQRTIPHISAADMLKGKGLERVKDRVVFIGATAEGLFDLRVTPFSPNMPGVEKHANMAANILERRFIVRPVWIELAEMAGIIAFPLLLAIALPVMRPVPSIGFTLAVWAALFGAAHYAFRRELWIPLVYPSLALVITFIAITVYRFLTEERQRQYTKRAFQQYVSPEVVARIVDNPEALQFGGELRNLTVLFSDIRDFTTFTEKNDPQLVVQMLREYLTEMTRIVIEEGGTLDKYIGDAVMAEFGAPIVYPDHALRGCRAALRMAAEVERLTAKWIAEGREPFRIGLGVNTGNMVVGNLGSEQLFDYTVIGDEVNLGARLESLNKDYQTDKHIIISDGTVESAGDTIEVRELGEVKVKGKTRPVVVYELLGLKNTPGA
jgi:adenylate cyclase